MIAPWPDFAGHPIAAGEVIEHPSGERGTVVFLPDETDPGDAWRVDYGTGDLSRLVLQIGDKGRAAVVPKTDEPNEGAAMSEQEKHITRSFEWSPDSLTTASVLGVWNSTPSRLLLPVGITFTPLPDITAYELARLLPLLMQPRMIMPYEVPTEPELLRHLVIDDPNKATS